jgi:hypothetical protein
MYSCLSLASKGGAGVCKAYILLRKQTFSVTDVRSNPSHFFLTSGVNNVSASWGAFLRKLRKVARNQG